MAYIMELLKLPDDVLTCILEFVGIGKDTNHLLETCTRLKYNLQFGDKYCYFLSRRKTTLITNMFAGRVEKNDIYHKILKCHLELYLQGWSSAMSVFAEVCKVFSVILDSGFGIFPTTTFGNVQQLLIFSCDGMRSVVQFAGIHTVVLISNNMITDVSALSGVRELTMFAFQNLVDVSSLRDVRYLNISKCAVADVSLLRNVETLVMHGYRDIHKLILKMPNVSLPGDSGGIEELQRVCRVFGKIPIQFHIDNRNIVHVGNAYAGLTMAPIGHNAGGTYGQTYGFGVQGLVGVTGSMPPVGVYNVQLGRRGDA